MNHQDKSGKQDIMSDSNLVTAQPMREAALQIFALLQPPVTSFYNLTSDFYGV